MLGFPIDHVKISKYHKKKDQQTPICDIAGKYIYFIRSPATQYLSDLAFFTFQLRSHKVKFDSTILDFKYMVSYLCLIVVEGITRLSCEK